LLSLGELKRQRWIKQAEDRIERESAGFAD
jgi:hypothetical protein